MNYLKELTLQEWKEKYHDYFGFAFISAGSVADNSIINLVEAIKFHKISGSDPVEVSRFDNVVLFAYEEFNGPHFFGTANWFEHSFQVAQIRPLSHYLKGV